MNVLARMRCSQALRLVPGRNWWNAAYALAEVSWTRSSASVGLRVMRSAAGYSGPRNGTTSCSNRRSRSGASSLFPIGYSSRSLPLHPRDVRDHPSGSVNRVTIFFPPQFVLSLLPAESERFLKAHCAPQLRSTSISEPDHLPDWPAGAEITLIRAGWGLPPGVAQP